MKIRTKIYLPFVLLLGIAIGCQNKNPKPDPALASIDLLRGDIALCGDPDFGELSFSLACKFETRETFDLAISLLHSFEYADAEKTFVKVIDADPECAMAYWGVAMSLYHSLWAPPGEKELEKGSKLLKIAAKLPKSERASAYLEAMNAFYNNWENVDHDTRQALYEEKMKQLYNSQKDDTEATIFYALAVRASADPKDRTYAKQREAGQLLEDLFKDQPNHPGIAHYIIHSYDYAELANLGLVTARRYAEIAPASAHAQHMPSHIFTRLGLWDESISSNVNSAASAVCYTEGVGEQGNWAQEIHALDYLVYAYLQKGDNQNANIQNDYLKNMTTVFPANHFAIAYTVNAIPARIALENKDWEMAASLQRSNITFDWEPYPWEQSILHFGRALGAARSGDIAGAENELAILKAFHQDLIEVKSAMNSYKADQVFIEIKSTEAWIEFAKGNTAQALDLMRLAVDLESQTTKHPVTPGEVLPANQLLGDMYLEVNDPANAIMAYEADLEKHPHRFNSIYGVAIAAKQSGDEEKASLYYSTLLEQTIDSNSDRPELEEARKYVGEI